MKTNRFSKLVIIFFTIFIIIISALFILKGEFKYIYNVVAIYLSILIFCYYEEKRELNISNYSKVLLLLLFVLHLLFGQYYDLYKTSNIFDKILHMFGTFAMSIFIYEIFTSHHLSFPKSEPLTLLLIFSLGITLGAFLEIIEFILDILLNSYNQKGLIDTNLDLIFNSLGASIASIRIAVKLKKINM